MPGLGKTKLALLCLAVIGSFACGCGASGPPRFHIRGSVTNDGTPLTVRPMVGRVQVTFYPVDETGKRAGDPQEAAILPTGKFTVGGTEGKGIVAGKYKIAVRWWDEFPTKDNLQGKYDEQNSTDIRDLKGQEDVVIDVKNVMESAKKG